MRRRRFILLLVAVALVLGLGLGVLWLFWPRPPDEFTIALASQREAQVWKGDYYIAVSPEAGSSFSRRPGAVLVPPFPPRRPSVVGGTVTKRLGDEFEMAVALSVGRSATLKIAGASDVRVTLAGQPVDASHVYPAGDHQVIVTGKYPAGQAPPGP